FVTTEGFAGGHQLFQLMAKVVVEEAYFRLPESVLWVAASTARPLPPLPYRGRGNGQEANTPPRQVARPDSQNMHFSREIRYCPPIPIGGRRGSIRQKCMNIRLLAFR